MPGRLAKIDRELVLEYKRLDGMRREKEQRTRARDRLLQSGAQTMADIETAMIEHLRLRIEEEDARIAGKEEVRNKPDDVTTTEIIEREASALAEKRATRDALLAKQNRTPEENAELERLNREIVLEGYRIEGKEIAGRIAGEYAMGGTDSAGGYRVAVYDASGEEILALVLPLGGTKARGRRPAKRKKSQRRSR